MTKENEQKYGIFTRLRKKELRKLEREFTKFLNDTVGMDIREEKIQEVWQWIEKLVEDVEREKSEEIEELKHWLKRYEKDISNAIN